MPIRYFAYGSNLWLKQMINRCPDNSLLGKGFLEGYRWIISKRGYANIVQSANDTVIGIVYEIAQSDERELDCFEGVDNGSYKKEMLDVIITGKRYGCLVYIDPIIEEGAPKEEYINRINQGIIDAELPIEYVNRYIRKYVPENIKGDVLQ